MNRTSASRLGQFVETAAGGERVRAFLPPPLPPDLPLDLQGLFTSRTCKNTSIFQPNIDRARGFERTLSSADISVSTVDA